MVQSGVKSVVAVILLMFIAKTSANACVGKNSGFVNDFYGCRNYFSCVGGFEFPMLCPEGFYFNEVNQRCDLAANVVCSPCPPTGIASIRNPSSCSKYRMCIAGKPLERECATGLWFDTKINKCNLIENVICTEINHCPATGVAIVPNLNNRTQFHICSDGIIIVTETCSPGLFFDITLLKCVVDTSVTITPPAATTFSAATTVVAPTT